MPSVSGPPTGCSALSGDGQAVVSFVAPADDGGDAITGYTVTSTPGSVTGTGATSPITVTGLANGKAYTFTAHATNGQGDSSESDPSNSVTCGTPARVNLSGAVGSRTINGTIGSPPAS